MVRAPRRPPTCPPPHAVSRTPSEGRSLAGARRIDGPPERAAPAPACPPRPARRRVPNSGALSGPRAAPKRATTSRRLRRGGAYDRPVPGAVGSRLPPPGGLRSSKPGGARGLTFWRATPSSVGSGPRPHRLRGRGSRFRSASCGRDEGQASRGCRRRPAAESCIPRLAQRGPAREVRRARPQPRATS